MGVAIKEMTITPATNALLSGITFRYILPLYIAMQGLLIGCYGY